MMVINWTIKDVNLIVGEKLMDGAALVDLTLVHLLVFLFVAIV